MNQLLNMIAYVSARFNVARDSKDRGATATEYALLVSFIAIVIIAGVTVFGNALSGFFNSLGLHVGRLGS